MCFSNDSIEKQLYEISKRIHRESIYTIIRMECVGGESLTLDKDNESVDVNAIMGSSIPIISKIFLKDGDDNHYTIRPTMNGLSFAEGKLTYNEYKRIERKGILNGYGIFCLIISAFLLTSWILVSFYF